MKLRLFYTPGTPDDRSIDHLCQQLQKNGITIEKVDADSREGAAIGELYDLMQRPAMLLTGDEGQVVQQWQGELPTAEAVSGYYWAS